MAALSTVGRNRSTLLSDSRKRCVANDSDIYSILDSLQGSARRLGNEGELGLNSGKSWSYMDRGGIGQQRTQSYIVPKVSYPAHFIPPLEDDPAMPPPRESSIERWRVYGSYRSFVAIEGLDDADISVNQPARAGVDPHHPTSHLHEHIESPPRPEVRHSESGIPSTNLIGFLSTGGIVLPVDAEDINIFDREDVTRLFEVYDAIGQAPEPRIAELFTAGEHPWMDFNWSISSPEADVSDPLHPVVQAFADGALDIHPSDSTLEAATRIVKAAIDRPVQPEIEFDVEEGVLALDIRLDNQHLLVARLELIGTLTVNIYNDEEGTWLEHLPNITAQELVDRL